MQSVSSRIWTRIAVFISYGDNDYTTGTSCNWLIVVAHFVFALHITVAKVFTLMQGFTIFLISKKIILLLYLISIIALYFEYDTRS